MIIVHLMNNSKQFIIHTNFIAFDFSQQTWKSTSCSSQNDEACHGIVKTFWNFGYIIGAATVTINVLSLNPNEKINLTGVCN